MKPGRFTLHESEAKAWDRVYALDGVADSTDDAIFSVDKDYRYTSFNASHAAAMQGLFDVEIKLGDSILDCHTVDEDRARAKADIDRALRGEVIKAQGFVGDEALSRRWFAMSHSPVPGADGLIAGVIVSARDITERKQAEVTLRESHDLLANLARLVPGVIYQYRLYPDGRSTFPYSSLGMNDIYEVTPEEVREDATPVFGRLHPDDYDYVADAIAESARTLNTFYCEFRVVLPRQGLRWRWSQAHPVRMGDGGTLWHGIISDVTERKQAEEALQRVEEQLRQSQKMEAVGRLAGGIAHDFNNLLTAILGYSDLILSNGASTVDEVRPDVEEIRRAGERARDLTRQILAFSRRQALKPEVVSLNAILTGMNSLLRRTLGEDIDLISLLQPDLGQVEADIHQFEQVLLNLAVNARDAMPMGGRLTLETANRELGEEDCLTHPDTAPGSYVMLAVTDTGAGMDADTRAHIFEPFFTTKGPGEGTGLGLATVYGIIRQSGGSISVHSEPGQGTSFKIFLPRVTAPTSVGPLAIRASLALGEETILVVEDEESIRGLPVRILGELGYTVFSAATAHEALELLATTDDHFDLLLTDVVLPGGMQGDDLARRVASSRPDLAVLYMSGYTRDAILHAGRLDEGVNYLEKPFTPEVLARMVRDVLDRVGKKRRKR